MDELRKTSGSSRRYVRIKENIMADQWTPPGTAKSRSNTRMAVKTLSNLINTRHEFNKAQMDFKKEQILQKIKERSEFDLKKQEKSLMSPFETEQLNQYKANPGGYDMSSGKPKALGLKDLAERVYMKPQDQWTPSDKQIVGQYQAMTQQVITDANGNPVGMRPKGSVFQPKSTDEDMGFLGGQPQTTQPSITQPSGRIRVRTKDGRPGTIDANEFDPNLYDQI